MRHEISMLGILFLLSAAPAWSTDFNASGIQAFRTGDYALAEQLYRQALVEETEKTKLATVYRNLSVLYDTIGQDGSAYLKKANELDPPAPPTAIKDDGQSVMINNAAPSTVSQGAAGGAGQSSPTLSGLAPQVGAGTGLNQSAGANLNASSLPLSPGGIGSGMGNATVFGSSNSSSLGGGLNFNGGKLGGGLNAGSRSSYGIPGLGSGGGLGYGGSYSGPDGSSGFSNSTPIILPVVNRIPVILNAPGPNYYSTQQAPDGSTTTIIKQTY